MDFDIRPACPEEMGQLGLMATSFVAFPFTIRANGRATAMAGISVVGTRPEYDGAAWCAAS